MNNSKKPGRRRGRGSAITQKILLQYLLAVFILLAALVFLFVLGMMLANTFTWYYTDPLYRILSWIRANYLLIAGIIFVSGWILLTYYFISRPLRYLDEVLAAAERLAAPDDQSILLPEPLKNVQDELNQVRENALRSARLAREAEQRKNDLIVYLAHDLKTPLTSVIGYLNLLQDEPDISPETRARYTGIALDKALRLEDLINEFFEITRFNLTSISLETEQVNLSRMLEQMADEFRPILAKKDLSWEARITPELKVLCDPGKLERVFDNLFRNAVNYSYPGSTILLSLVSEPEGIRICVKNHGRTIPPEKLSRIFDQFFRLDSSRSSSTGGAGLGLAIAREIVELHGGRIFAESAQESIAFTVQLPFSPSVRKS